MSTVNIVNTKNESVGEIELNDRNLQSRGKGTRPA